MDMQYWAHFGIIFVQELPATTRSYAVIKGGLDCIPNIPFNSSLMTLHLSDTKAGDTYIVCAIFQDDDCIAMTSTNVTGE